MTGPRNPPGPSFGSSRSYQASVCKELQPTNARRKGISLLIIRKAGSVLLPDYPDWRTTWVDLSRLAHRNLAALEKVSKLWHKLGWAESDHCGELLMNDIRTMSFTNNQRHQRRWLPPNASQENVREALGSIMTERLACTD